MLHPERDRLDWVEAGELAQILPGTPASVIVQLATRRCAPGCHAGEFNPASKNHAAANIAIEHSCIAPGCHVEGGMGLDEDIEDALLARYAGIWEEPYLKLLGLRYS